jgi:hypothetical protein
VVERYWCWLYRARYRRIGCHHKCSLRLGHFQLSKVRVHCPESLMVGRLTDGIVAEDLQLEMREQHETVVETVLEQRLV